jgi:VanZ family protein
MDRFKAIPYKRIIFIFFLSCLFCGWPGFHPEEYLGLSYHWALDMFFHSTYYFSITIFLLWLFHRHVRIMVFYLSLLTFSFILEFIQLWIPDRTFTLLDLTSNFLGITSGCFMFLFLKYLWSGEKK